MKAVLTCIDNTGRGVQRKIIDALKKQQIEIEQQHLFDGDQKPAWVFIVDTSKSPDGFIGLQESMRDVGDELSSPIKVQRAELFTETNRIQYPARTPVL